MRASAAIPIALSLAAPAALAQERCLAAHYRLPAGISEDLRPYLICGMLQGDGHVSERINDHRVHIQGNGLESCAAARSRALVAADQRMRANMPDAAARAAFLRTEFEKLDRFLTVAARSYDLGMGEEPNAPPCRNQNASN